MRKKKEKTQILVIEDNPGDAHLVRIFLKEGGLKHELHHSESFYEGIEIVEDNPINLVLLDLSLPDSHGFRTLTNFREKFPKMPVIVLTGLDDEVVGMQAVKAGAQDYLVKGQFDSNLLSRVIRYSLQRHSTQQRLEQYARNLAISEKRLVEAQEMAHFGHWEVDIVTNEMVWADETYRIFGFRPQSLSPTLSDYLSYVHPEDKGKVEDTFGQVIKDGELRKIEYRIIVDGHQIKYIVNQVKVYYDDITEKILLVGAVQNITDQKRSEQLTIEKNITNKASKVKEEILENMSFHIRTPLSSILNLSFLLENANPNAQQKEYLDSLKTSINDLSITVNNLLNFSILTSQKVKLEEVEFKVHNFIQSIKQVVQVKASDKSIDLDFSVNAEVPEILVGDANKINQILYNLIDNAIKFSNKNTSVQIRLYATPIEDDRISLTLEVKDQGQGLSRSQITSLLASDRLLSEDDNSGISRKLGIPIVNKLAQTMGGSISIDSREGIGSRFTVDVPVRYVKVKKRVVKEKPTEPMRILLVEDHFLNQLATKRVLTTWSEYVSVDIAENGQVGLDKFKAHPYDLILMDLQMPVMNGYESTIKIREKSQIPIVALSANNTSHEVERAKKVGMNDYLAKPFKPEELYEKIMMVLA